MRLMWDEDAWEEYLYWQTQDKKTLKRVNLLLKDIQRNVFEGIGEPEPLKNKLSGWWSRRLADGGGEFLLHRLFLLYGNLDLYIFRI